MGLDTAVVLIGFNRPAVTRRVTAAIAAARPARLFLVADGPRADRAGESALCEETRAVMQGVDWPCDIQRNFSPTNLGCRRRIASGLDWVFSQVDEAIILEDDCLPAPAFFPFCEQLLERHRRDERVQMVRGVTLLTPEQSGPDSYHFSRFYNIWGWATWARAWRHFDVDMKRWPEVRDTGWLEHYLGSKARAQLMRHFLEETHAGRIDTWDYPWVLSGWLRGALAATPSRNLVTNIGFGEHATHESDAQSALASLPTSELAFPLRHPRKVAVDEAADDLEWSRVYPDAADRRPWEGLRRRLRRLLR
jgi:hypothetical protein